MFIKAGFAVLVVAAASLSLSACSGGPDVVPGPSSSTAVEGGSAAPKPFPTSTTAASQSADVFALKVGDCLNDNGDFLVSDVPKVDCSSEHDLEIYDEFELTDASFDPVAINKEAEEGCKIRFQSFVGISYDDSELDELSYTPTATSWPTGDRLVSCAVGEHNGKTVGTLRGAAR